VRNLVCAWLVAALVAVSGAAEPPSPTSPDDNGAGEGEETTPAENEDAAFGKTIDTDYTAKNFFLLFGATILDPFEFKEVMPDDGGEGSSAQTDDEDPEKMFNLKTGDVDANFFIELGFRYRWAWMDRLSVAESLRLDALEKIKNNPEEWARVRAKLRAVKSAIRARESATAADDATKAELDQKVTEAIDALDEDPGFREIVATGPRARRAWEDATVDHFPAIAGRLFPQDLDCWLMSANSDYCKEGDNLTRLAAALVPSDWAVRMGYVFDGNSPDASTLAGASNLYGEFVSGWSLARWSMANGSPDLAPIRGSFNFEVATSLATDRDISDVHPRVLIGSAVAFGVPFRFLETDEEDDDQGEDGEPDLDSVERNEFVRRADALLSDDAKADPIVELVARAGAVYVETPQFISKKGRMVEVENDVPKFEGDWGFGFDLEMNVPVPGNMGYIVSRGSINAGFDPNPWLIQIGYTIPIGRLAEALTAGVGSGS
jgi:hypothetical protein